jgi:hypothetical protein
MQHHEPAQQAITDISIAYTAAPPVKAAYLN